VKRIFCCVLLITIITAAAGNINAINESASAVVYPQISAKGAVVIDVQSGRVLFEKNMSERMGMASTTNVVYT
jgi:D-alanyl-D-alanine carboxypeptidase (penicillin-binding protein 5/6)